MPKLSVGMPVYNGEADIHEAVNSVLSQTFTDFELIISDNASTDSTQVICEEYARKDSRVRYIRNDVNIGASDNYNAVVYKAEGQYFKWASSNDYCMPTFFEKCIEVLDNNQDVVVCYPRAKLFRHVIEDGEEYVDGLTLSGDSACERLKVFFEAIQLNNVMNGLIRTEMLKKTSLIKVYFSSDTVMMGELSLYGKYVEIPEYLFYRRMDEATATKLKSSEEVIKHYLPEGKSHMLLQNWKMHFGYVAAVFRAPIPFLERLCALRLVIKRMKWDRIELFNEVVFAIKIKFGSKS